MIVVMVVDVGIQKVMMSHMDILHRHDIDC